MRFRYLVDALRAGFLEQIPVVGPMIEAIFQANAQRASEDRIIEEIREIVATAGGTPAERQMPTLVPSLLMAEAELASRLVTTPPRPAENRWVYLAADNYADSERTAEFASHYGFLWRGYHNADGNRIANVQHVRLGDVVILCYRDSGSFRVLAPYVVVASSPHTEPITTVGDFGPFVWATPALQTALADATYTPDPVFREPPDCPRMSGLAVSPLALDLTDPATVAVFSTRFKSPTGNNAIWDADGTREKPKPGQDRHYFPPQLRTWALSLSRPPSAS
jgi:hypothetical protein